LARLPGRRREAIAGSAGWLDAISARVCWSRTSMKASSASSRMRFTRARLGLRPPVRSSISTCVTSVARTTSPIRIAPAGRANRTPPLRPRTASIRWARANRLTILNTFCWVISRRPESSATLTRRPSARAQSIRILMAWLVDLVRRIAELPHESVGDQHMARRGRESERAQWVALGGALGVALGIALGVDPVEVVWKGHCSPALRVAPRQEGCAPMRFVVGGLTLEVAQTDRVGPAPLGLPPRAAGQRRPA